MKMSKAFGPPSPRFAVLLLVLLAGFDLVYRQERHGVRFQLSPGRNGEPKGEASFVTQVFPLEGRTSNVEVTTTANVDNSAGFILNSTR